MLYVKGFAVWHLQKKSTTMWCGRIVKLTRTSFDPPVLEVLMCQKCLASKWEEEDVHRRS